MKYSLLLLLTLLLTVPAAAQDEADNAPPEGWQYGAGIGLDLAQLLQINPRQGAGQNRLGLGGAVNAFANYRRGRVSWENTALWQFGVERLGSGVIARNSDINIPFQKSIDEFRLGSKYGYQIKPDGQLYYSANATLLTQLTPTYQFPEIYAGNFISDFVDSGRTPLSTFFAPATATFSLGIDWQPTDNLSLFYSPIGVKAIIVAKDSIAALGVHGNEVEGEPNDRGFYPEFENSDVQLGSLLQAKYRTTFGTDDRLIFTSNLGLYSNYLRNPQNIDVDWQNALAFAITENLQINLLLNILYDDDIRVQITDFDEPNGVSGLGQRVSLTQQLIISYARTF